MPQDPCIPDPNTCCRGPSTQPGWPQYGPYFCAGAGGLCTNTAVDKNVREKRSSWINFFPCPAAAARRKQRLNLSLPLFPCSLPRNHLLRTAAPVAPPARVASRSPAAPGAASTSTRPTTTAPHAGRGASEARRVRTRSALVLRGPHSRPTASPASSRPARPSALTAPLSRARATRGELLVEKGGGRRKSSSFFFFASTIGSSICLWNFFFSEPGSVSSSSFFSPPPAPPPPSPPMTTPTSLLQVPRRRLLHFGLRPGKPLPFRLHDVRRHRAVELCRLRSHRSVQLAEHVLSRLERVPAVEPVDAGLRWPDEPEPDVQQPGDRP